MSTLKEVDLETVFNNRKNEAERHLQAARKIATLTRRITAIKDGKVRFGIEDRTGCFVPFDFSSDTAKPIKDLVIAELERQQQNMLDDLEVAL